jgi:hypothetical protein
MGGWRGEEGEERRGEERREGGDDFTLLILKIDGRKKKPQTKKKRPGRSVGRSVGLSSRSQIACEDMREDRSWSEGRCLWGFSYLAVLVSCFSYPYYSLFIMDPPFSLSLLNLKRNLFSSRFYHSWPWAWVSRYHF